MSIAMSNAQQVGTEVREDREDMNASRTGGRNNGRLVGESLNGAELNYAVMMHLSALLGMVSMVLYVVPLVMWLVRRQDSQFIDDHGRDLVNFLLSLLVYSIPLCWIPHADTALALVGAVNFIRGSSAAYYGEYFRYPITIRFLN